MPFESKKAGKFSNGCQKAASSMAEVGEHAWALTSVNNNNNNSNERERENKSC